MSEYDVILNELKHMNEKIDDICKDMVTRDEFKPVRNIVYGFVTIILVGVIGALLSLIIPRTTNAEESKVISWLVKIQTELM